MRSRPAIMNKCNMIRATEYAKDRVRRLIDRANEVTADARKIDRLKKHECKACFYESRIGGSAITMRPCMSCGNEEMYGSTATDVLCMKCATKHNLCKHCGGDIEMRARRKNWPDTPDLTLCTTDGTQENETERK